MTTEVPADELRELIHGGHAEECLRRATAMLERADISSVRLQLLGIVSVANQYVGRYRDSLMALYEGMDLAREVDDPGSLGWLASLAAADHARLGDSVAALRMLSMAQNVVAGLDHLTCMRVWNNTAVTHHIFSQWSEAVDAITYAIEHANRLEEEYPRVHATSNLVLYRLMQAQDLLETDKAAAAEAAEVALAMASECEAEAVANNWPHVIGTMYREVGPLLCAFGEHARARELLTRCIASALEVGRDREVGALAIRMAVVERLDGSPAPAMALLQQAAAVVERFDDAELRIELQLELANVHEALGDSAAALREFRAYHGLFRARVEALNDAKAQVLAARLGVERARVQSERHQARARELESTMATLADQARQLSHDAVTDPLTGVGNRRLFDSRIGEMLGRPDEDVSLMFIDLDHFKVVNDVLGHHVGDTVLNRLGQILRDSLRPQDLICRYGGEEFLVALPGTDAALAAGIAERLRLAVAAHPWKMLAPTLRVTCSIGVTTGRGIPLQEMLFDADQALYSAKAGGRDQVVAAARTVRERPAGV